MVVADLKALGLGVLSTRCSEEKLRAVLTDTDLLHRDVITLICENNCIEFLQVPYVEKLADEVWDGPPRVRRSPLWLSTAWMAVTSIFREDHSLQDPFQRRAERHRSRKEEDPLPEWAANSAWGFTAWRDGLMPRYSLYILVAMAAMFYTQGILLRNQQLFAKEI